VTHNAISIFWFSGDKMGKAWMQSDRLDFYQQIGIISADTVTSLAEK
jgi:hypothetical protein